MAGTIEHIMNETFKTIINAYVEIFKNKDKNFKNFKREVKDMLKLSDNFDKITIKVDNNIKKVLKEELSKTPENAAQISSEIPKKTEFIEQETNSNKVYFVDYDMVQTNLVLLSKGKQLDNSLNSDITLFNEYFGGSMSSIVSSFLTVVSISSALRCLIRVSSAI